MGKNRAYPFPPLDPSAARIVAYLDGLSPSLRFGDVSRQEMVNALREPHKGAISHKGTMLQSATGDASQVAPALWAVVDLAPIK